ncbi:MAG: ribonuclease D [Planctomycetes bacterium]|nr:ribonuclease D [Planctomycetota bacterium]
MSSLPPHLPPGANWIDTPGRLAEAISRMSGERELAIDTEADSYYVYRVKVCLLQVSSRTEEWLIDPLAGFDLAPFGELCADPSIRKVLHAASNDVALLRKVHGFRFENLFDTMVASQVLGLRRPGLASLLLERFGVEQKKTYQTSDWGKRPLSEGQLHYAAADTRYLLPLHDQLKAELEAKGRLEEAFEDFGRLCESEQTERGFDPDAWQRAAGAIELDPQRIQVLRELFVLRDEIASRRDKAPHRIFRDDALVAIAQVAPRGRADLAPLQRIAGWQLEREADAVLDAVARGLARPPWVRERRRAREIEGEAPLTEREQRLFEALRQWRRERAGLRDVEESRVATTGTLRAIAREAELTKERLASVVGMSPFRVREYGDEIVAVAAKVGEG